MLTKQERLIASALGYITTHGGDAPILAIVQHWHATMPATTKGRLALTKQGGDRSIVLAVGLSEAALGALQSLINNYETKPLATEVEMVLVHGFDGAPRLDLPYIAADFTGSCWLSVLVTAEPIRHTSGKPAWYVESLAQGVN